MDSTFVSGTDCHCGMGKESLRVQWLRNCARQTMGTVAAAWIAGTCSLQAQPITIPNFSFESPATTFVDPRIDHWQKTPQPGWYDPVTFGGYTWDQTMGLFMNVPPGDARHIPNCDGAQAIYLFAIPGVGLFQDYNSTDWRGGSPSHAFDAVFQPGLSYKLTVGVMPGNGLLEGASLRLGLYYLDNAQMPQPVAATDILYTAAAFPGTPWLTDFEVNVPTVLASDAWAGRHLGIEIVSTSMGGTFWDVDNVRLTAVPEPGVLSLLALGAAPLLSRRCRWLGGC